jgi:hypothetical protein
MAAERARNWLFDLFTHHHAEQLRINRAIQRQKMGLPQEDLPYPGSVAASGNPTTVYNQNGGWLKGALLAVGSLLAGGATMAVVGTLLKRSALPTAAASPPAAAAPQPKPREFDIQFRIEGGELKIDPPVPVQP